MTDPSIDRGVTDQQRANHRFALCSIEGSVLDVFDLGVASDIWLREIAAGDGVHPNEGGYSVIADAVENWAGWRAWMRRHRITLCR
jgi:hypothetical protein